MNTRILSFAFLCLLTITAATVDAQDRGSRRGGRGGGDDSGDRGDGGGGFGRRGGGGFGRGNFDPAEMMDRNKNGMIDQEEIDRIPSFIRDRMIERGEDIVPGTSVDQYREDFSRRMEKMREEWKVRNEARQNGESDNANRTTPSLPFKPRDKQRITVDIPQEYTASDTDKDGQIGLYEWIVSRRDDLELFDEMDRDSDGLLTPKELVAWDALRAEAGKATPTKVERPKLVIVGGTDPAPQNGSQTQSGNASDDRDWRGDRSDRWGRGDRGDRGAERGDRGGRSRSGRGDSEGDSGRDERRRQAMENIRNGRPPWGDGPPPWERDRD